MRSFIITIFALAIAQISHTVHAENNAVNILLITADDMNWDTPNLRDSEGLPMLPNLDKLRQDSLSFDHAHVTVAVCQPSRQTWMTGRYPHRQGAMGFLPIKRDIPTLGATLKAAGYYTAMMGKIDHHEPIDVFGFEEIIQGPTLPGGRDPSSFAKHVSDSIDNAKSQSKPFFIVVNSHDPHRPLYGSPQDIKWYGWKGSGVAAPSKVFAPSEISVPGFLPELPEVRKEIAQYISSSRRLDDTVGAVLEVLREKGCWDNTIIMFLSDNGMPFPFAKGNCYLNSTRTPWYVRVPGVTASGKVDNSHYISGIDLMPTLLELVGVPIPDGLDGTSFVPILKGKKQENRDRVFTAYYKSPDKSDYSMRCVQVSGIGYIFNGWVIRGTIYNASPLKTDSFASMKEAAKTNPEIEKRVKFLQHRVPEELYDMAADPDCLNNLADDPKYESQMKEMRSILVNWMHSTDDPLLPSYKEYLTGK